MADITIAEEKIKAYYFAQKKIAQLEYSLKCLYDRKKELQGRLNSTVTVSLDDDFRAVSYDGVGGKGANIYNMSPQDRAVEKPFKLLETRILKVNEEIFITEDEIAYLRQKNSEIEYVLNALGEEYKIIVEGFYRDNKGIVQMEFELNMDKATIYRKKKKVLYDVWKWLG